MDHNLGGKFARSRPDCPPTPAPIHPKLSQGIFVFLIYVGGGPAGLPFLSPPLENCLSRLLIFSFILTEREAEAAAAAPSPLTKQPPLMKIYGVPSL